MILLKSLSFGSLRILNSTTFNICALAKRPNININLVANHHPIHNAHTLLSSEKMFHRQISSFNFLLASYVDRKDAFGAWDLFLYRRRTSADLNSYSFVLVLQVSSIFSSHLPGQQVHALMIRIGLNTETVTQTALINMYSKCGQLDSSFSVFDGMDFKDVVAWNTMFSSFIKHNLPGKALQLFEEMRREIVEFSEFTLCSVLKACTSLRASRQGLQVHGLVIVIGRDLVVLSTALIDFYCSVGCIDKAIKIYDSLNCIKDDKLNNSLIARCVENKKYRMALSVMRTMRPNTVALTTALSACSEDLDLSIGRQIHSIAVRQDFLFDTQLCNALLDMYAKCGKLSNAQEVFEAVPRKDVVSWTSIISAYGSHGYGFTAFELFSKMGTQQCGVLPNSVTLLAVLSACAHSGMVEEGRQCLLHFQKFALVPGPEHYACFMDMLGRAGRNEEVWYTYDEMMKNGIKPTTAVWAALLNACKINQDIKRGEFAAKNLLASEPGNPGNYVALSNFYAVMGRWDAVDRLRNIIRNKGFSKEVGSSWVTVSGMGEKLHASSGKQCVQIGV